MYSCFCVYISDAAALSMYMYNGGSTLKHVRREFHGNTAIILVRLCSYRHPQSYSQPRRPIDCDVRFHTYHNSQEMESEHFFHEQIHKITRPWRRHETSNLTSPLFSQLAWNAIHQRCDGPNQSPDETRPRDRDHRQDTTWRQRFRSRGRVVDVWRKQIDRVNPSQNSDIAMWRRQTTM